MAPRRAKTGGNEWGERGRISRPRRLVRQANRTTSCSMLGTHDQSLTRAARGRDRSSRIGFRSVTIRDLPVLVEHRRRMWEAIGSYSRLDLDQADATYERWLRKKMRDRRFVACIAETSERAAVGSGGIWLQPAQPRPGRLQTSTLPYLMSMYTDPAYRARGIASEVVRWAIRWSRARSYPRLILHASPWGRALYRKLGFVRGWEMRIDLYPAKRSLNDADPRASKPRNF